MSDSTEGEDFILDKKMILKLLDNLFKNKNKIFAGFKAQAQQVLTVFSKLFPGNLVKLCRIAIPMKNVSPNPSAVAKAILPDLDRLTTMYTEINKS